MTSDLGRIDPRDFRRALSLVRFLRDPVLPGLLLMAGLVLSGLFALAYGWYGTARAIYVPLQLPEVVSGGLGGLGLIGLGAGLFDIHLDRYFAARELRLTDDVLDELAGLAALGPKLRHRAVARRGQIRRAPSRR
jgi:hypothetical protein